MEEQDAEDAGRLIDLGACARSFGSSTVALSATRNGTSLQGNGRAEDHCHGHAQSSDRQNQFANCLVPSRAHARTWTSSESKCAACAERLKLTADCLTADPNRIMAKLNRGYQVLEPNH